MKNRIHSIYDSGDNLASSPSQIDEVFINYFQNLFTSSSPSWQAVEECLENVKNKVTAEMNTELVKQYTKVKVQEALNQMTLLKSPCPDGYNVRFNQSYWHIVGEDVSLASL